MDQCYTAENMVCLCNTPAQCRTLPPYYSPLKGFHWRDRCSYASALPQSEKDTCACSHTNTCPTIYNTHNHMCKHLPPPLAVYCLVTVYVWGGYSGTQGNGTWGYSGLNGSSGYAAAHKVPVWAPQRLMRLCTQCLAQLQRTGVCVSLNCPPVVWASPSGRPCPLAAI